MSDAHKARCRTCNQLLANHLADAELADLAELAQWLAERKAKAQGELEGYSLAEEILMMGEG